MNTHEALFAADSGISAFSKYWEPLYPMRAPTTNPPKKSSTVINACAAVLRERAMPAIKLITIEAAVAMPIGCHSRLCCVFKNLASVPGHK